MKRKVFRGRDVADLLNESSARESHSPHHVLQSRATNSSKEVSSFMQAQSRATTPSTGHSRRRSISINHEEISSQPSSIRRRLVDEPDLDEPTSVTSNVQSKDNEVLEKVFVSVMGDDGHGRVRTMGMGVTPSMIKSRGSSSAFDLQSEIEKIRLEHEEQLKKLREEFDEKLCKAREEERELVIREVINRMKDEGGTLSRHNINSEHTSRSIVGDGGNGESIHSHEILSKYKGDKGVGQEESEEGQALLSSRDR